VRFPGMTYMKGDRQELYSVSHRQAAALLTMYDEVKGCMKWRGKTCLDLCVPEHHVPLRLCASQMSFLCDE
jgi:hypothetical protein